MAVGGGESREGGGEGRSRRSFVYASVSALARAAGAAGAAGEVASAAAAAGRVEGAAAAAGSDASAASGDTHLRLGARAAELDDAEAGQGDEPERAQRPMTEKEEGGLQGVHRTAAEL